MNPDSPLTTLINAPIRSGRIIWIGLRPERRKDMLAVQTAKAVIGLGLEGDRFTSKTQGKRQITLIQSEHLKGIASYLGREKIDPTLLRRNLVTAGINLLALKNKKFYVGNVLLEYSGECHPCSRMEENLGTGGYNAVRGHGGITARVIDGGIITINDALQVIDENQRNQQS